MLIWCFSFHTHLILEQYPSIFNFGGVESGVWAEIVKGGAIDLNRHSRPLWKDSLSQFGRMLCTVSREIELPGTACCHMVTEPAILDEVQDLMFKKFRGTPAVSHALGRHGICLPISCLALFAFFFLIDTVICRLMYPGPFPKWVHY